MSSLRNRIFLGTVLIALAASLAAAGLTLAASQRASLAAQGQHAETLARTLSEAALEPAYELDVKALRQLAASVRSGADSVTAVFLDAGGRVLTDGTDDNPLRGKNPGYPALRHALEHREWSTHSDRGTVRVAGPIMATPETHLGYVLLEHPADPLFTGPASEVRLTALIAAAWAFLTCAAAYLAAGKTAWPVEHLAFCVSHARQGRGSRRLPDAGPAEVRQLAQDCMELLTRPKDEAGTRQDGFLKDSIQKAATTLAHEG